MRQALPKHLRKKSLFSCDRCKTRKIACKRKLDGSETLEEDTTIDCIECRDKGLKCSTTIKRKRRIHGPVEILGLQYRCLISLFEGIFKNIDVNNVDSLIQIGREMNIQMPSRTSVDNADIETSLEFGLILKGQGISLLTERELETASLEDDKFILDSSGVSHFLGVMGVTSLLANTGHMMMNYSEEVSKEFHFEYHRLYGLEGLMELSNGPLSSSSFDIPLENYPYVTCLTKEMSDYNIRSFFSSCKQHYEFLNEERFFNLYNRYWDEEGKAVGIKSGLSTAEVCYIYLLNIFGFYHGLRPSNVEGTFIMEALLKIVRSALSEFILRPSIDAIICLTLLAIFCDSCKKRECGYLLIELACRQAIALGLSRQSILECYPDNRVQEERKRLWWFLFVQEIKFCNLLGRSSTIAAHEITLKYPIAESGDHRILCFNHWVELHKIVYQMNESRLPLQNKSSLSNPKNKLHVLDLRIKFKDWYDKLNSYSFSEIAAEFKYRLVLEYHDYNICLLIHSLLNACETQLDQLNALDIRMIADCVESAININSLLQENDQNIIFSGLTTANVLHAFHAALSLCTAYMWMHSNELEEISDDCNRKITLNEIKETMCSLRSFNKCHLIKYTATNAKITKYIEALLGSFYFMAENDLKPFSFIEQNPLTLKSDKLKYGFEFLPDLADSTVWGTNEFIESTEKRNPGENVQDLPEISLHSNVREILDRVFYDNNVLDI